VAIPLVASCATQSLGPSRELVNARTEYARAADSNAAVEAPKSLEHARVTLRAAEEAHQNSPGSQRERELAYMAMRRAQAAIADGNAQAAQRDAELARDELRRSTEDAARAVEAARARADAASQQAQTEAQKRQAAEQAAASAQSSLEQVEGELAEIRRQIAAQGNRLDEQTTALKDREAALQAQVDTLRAERDQAERDRSEAERERDQALQAMREVGDVSEQEDKSLIVTIPGEVMFRTNRASLLPRAKQKLDQLAEALQHLGPDQTFMIEGHTDARGSDRYNQRLSRLRAMAVRSYLIEQGVDPDRIRAVGRGEDEPIASNANPEGRANNRRVEIVVTPSAVSSR
jgi:outer membrane protein OmpA-like peptidoglycan-associated protein